MSASLPVLLFVLALLVCGLHAETRAEAPLLVRIAPDRVEIRARRAPLAEVLDAIAVSQGFVVDYDGPRPMQVVTVTLFSSRVEDALGSLLFHARAKYALSVDPKTRQVRRLVVVSTAAPPPTRPTPEPTPISGWRPDPIATVDEPPLADHPSPPDK